MVNNDNMSNILDQASEIECNVCGGIFFAEVFLFKKITPIIAPDGVGGVVPIKVFSCLECGSIAKELIPCTINKYDTSDASDDTSASDSNSPIITI